MSVVISRLRLALDWRQSPLTTAIIRKLGNSSPAAPYRVRIARETSTIANHNKWPSYRTMSQHRLQMTTATNASTINSSTNDVAPVINSDRHDKLLRTSLPTSPTSMTSVVAVEFERAALVSMVRNLLPELSGDRHKGEAGRIGVLGGCREYTGAPYFAAISALKVGCDLSHVFCTSEAAPVIKSYSPELIVHPVLDNRNAVDEIAQWLPRLNALIIGPGLGRDDKMYYHVRDVIQIAQKLDMPIVIDADGLFFITQYPEVIKGSKKLVLTPNVVEFARLYRKLVGTDLPSKEEEEEAIVSVNRVGELLDNVTIVRKGERDIIADGVKYLVCDHQGSPRRCGGQGDLLSGSLGAFAYWSCKATTAFQDEDNTSITSSSSSRRYLNPLLIEYGASMCAAYAACWLTRECSRRAFAYCHRSTTTTDMIAKIGTVIRCLELDEEEDNAGDDDQTLESAFPLVV